MTKSDTQMMKGVAILLMLFIQGFHILHQISVDNILGIVYYQLCICKTDFAIIRRN